MRVAFLVNEVATEVDEYTTTRLARAAARAGHDVWYVGVGDVELSGTDGQLVARARAARLEDGDTLATFMERVKERAADRVVMDDLENTVSALIGFEIRSIRSAAEAERRLLGAEDSYASSQGTTSVVPQNIARSAYPGANEVRDPASAAPDFKNPRSSAFICG